MSRRTKILIGVAAYFCISSPIAYILIKNTDMLLLELSVYSVLSVAIVFSAIFLNTRYVKQNYEDERTMLYNMLEDVDAMIALWSPDKGVLNVNECFTMITGYDLEALSNTQLWQSVFRYEPSQNDETICADKETTIFSSENQQLNILWKTTKIEDCNAGCVYMSIGVDLSELSAIQDELCASQRRMELSMELSGIGLLYRLVGSDMYFMSKNLQKLLGFSSENVSVIEFREKIHPRDKNIYDTYLANTEERAFDELHKVTSIEIRIECMDGGYHWFNYRYQASDYFGSKSLAVGGCLIDISKDKEKDTLIEKMAYIDEVTQIFNRNRFMIMGQETYSCAKDLGLSYWMVIFDVDKFHIINDTCGYQNGNALLKAIAIEILKKLSDGGFCARIGGDNFAVIIKDNGDDNLPLLIIKEIQNSLLSLCVDIFANQTITVSAGYCKMPADGADFAEILEHAEFALRLGENPRANIVRYDNSVHDRIIARSQLEKELQKALDNNELVLYYQPKISLSDNKVVGMEALIRWVKPDGSIIPPGLFIPVAENSYLITRISEFVVNEACRQNYEWQKMGLPKVSVSVNLTSVDFYQTDVCKTIQDAIDTTGLSPEWLEVELTESLALKDVDQAIRQMNELREIGINLSMDDFGTGYSSLSYIQILPITLLKLDRSFIMYLEEDDISRQIVTAVINICKSKKIRIIAEGIETLAQAEILKISGCDHAQGYLFGKPMPSKQFEEYLRKAI